MSKPEDRLQKELERLEASENWEFSLASETGEDQALLSLAARLRTAQWPQRDPQVVAAQREQIIKRYGEEPAMETENKSRSNIFKNWRLPLAIATVIALLVCGLVTMVGIGSLFITQQRAAVPKQPVSIDTSKKEDLLQETEDTKTPEQIASPADILSPNEALLTDIQGLVEIQAGDQWRVVQNEAKIVNDTHLRTGSFSSVSLTFKDGSFARIGPNSEISLETLAADPDAGKSTIVLMQFSGESQHQVVTLGDGETHYQVDTPTASGTAQGTEFHLRVSAEQTAWYVDEGVVEIASDQAAVLVGPGEMTTVAQDEEPQDPVYFIAGQGEVAAIGEAWIIADQVYQTYELTVIVGNPQVGDIVFFEGHLTEGEARMLDLIVLIRRNPTNTFRITGEVETIDDVLWTVNGQTIAVTDLTEIDEDIVVGDEVHVKGIILEDGSLQAATIRLLEAQPGTPFDFTGVIQSINEQSWLISDVNIMVDENSVIDEGLEVGETVQVQGWILDDGTWLASAIRRVLDENSAFEFSGYIEGMDPWMVAGIPFEVRDWTDIDADLQVGELVHVAGQIQPDGTWVAFEVKRFDDALLTILIGRVFSMDPWVVSGISLNVDDETMIEGEITIGMLVRVELQMLPDGNHKVIRIEPLEGFVWELGCHYLVVTVVSLDGDQIQLEGWPALPLGEEIQIEGEIQPGSIVQIMVCFDEDMNVVVVYIIVIYQPPPPDDSGGDDGKVTVCHKPNSKNPHTIVISKSALPAHLGHGDILGPCP